MLRLLKRSNANIDTLITVYTTIIRPVLEYACQVWHYNIQQYLSQCCKESPQNRVTSQVESFKVQVRVESSSLEVGSSRVDSSH